MRKIKDSPHYLHLKESVQNRYERKNFLIFSVLMGGIFLFLLLMFLPLGSASGGLDDATSGGLVFLALVILGVLLFLAYRWLEIFLHIDSYIFCEVVLDQPHVQGGRYGSSVHFTVEFTDRHGKRLKRDTAAMFSSHWEPYLEDYNNKKVLIGYNEETDRVVVIKRLDA